MTGQGTVIGNPDSMLYYRPGEGGRYRLVVRDRIGRSGPDMAYRLRVEEREPGFALLSDPENLNVRAGATERLGILLTPEPGFEQAVATWVDGPPSRNLRHPGQVPPRASSSDRPVTATTSLSLSPSLKSRSMPDCLPGTTRYASWAGPRAVAAPWRHSPLSGSGRRASGTMSAGPCHPYASQFLMPGRRGTLPRSLPRPAVRGSSWPARHPDLLDGQGMLGRLDFLILRVDRFRAGDDHGSRHGISLL